MNIKIKIAILVIFISLIFLLNSQEDINKISFSKISHLKNVKEIQMYEETGWFFNTNNQLFYTNNGIDNFEEIKISKNITEKTKSEAYFYNEKTCYLLCYNNNQIEINYTQNCGQTWKQSYIPAEYGCHGSFLSMINEQEGYLLYCSGSSPIIIKLYHTKNGCESFEYICDINSIESFVEDFSVSPKGTAYIVVDFRGNVQNTTMYMSTDMIYWQECDFSLDNNTIHYITSAPIFINSNEGYVLIKVRNNLNKHYFFVTKTNEDNWINFKTSYRKNEFVNMSIDSQSKQMYLIDTNGNVYITDIK